MNIQWLKNPSLKNPSHWVFICLMGAMFSAPISASLESICMVSSLIAIVLMPTCRARLMSILTHTWCICGISLFMLSVLGCLWSSASWHDAGIVVGKYSKLLYLPILVAGFSEQAASDRLILAIHAFLLAMLLTAILACARAYGWINSGDNEAGSVFRNHIMTGYMMAFAAYLAALLAMSARSKRAWIYGAMAVLFSYAVLFIGRGRTSYLIYVMFLLFFLCHAFSWRRAVWSMLVASGVLVAIYSTSVNMHDRVHEAIHDVRSYQQHTEKNTPVGFRLQFHAFARELFDRHPWIGNGTSGFSAAYQQEQPVPEWGPSLFEPHSQYWLVAADWGVLGLVLLALFFGSLSLKSIRLDAQWRLIAVGLLASFLLGSTVDSLLLYAGTGYFFLLFMALCLASAHNDRQHSV